MSISYLKHSSPLFIIVNTVLNFFLVQKITMNVADKKEPMGLKHSKWNSFD